MIFQQAIKTALQVDATNIAGLATLTLIEEIAHLPPATLQAAYQKAHEWLSDSQSQDVIERLRKASGRLTTKAEEKLTSDEATEVLLSKPGDLQDRMLKYEGAIIKQALAQANGRISHAAPLLGMTYQGLAYIIETRHPDLIAKRSSIRRRPRRQ